MTRNHLLENHEIPVSSLAISETKPPLPWPWSFAQTTPSAIGTSASAEWTLLGTGQDFVCPQNPSYVVFIISDEAKVAAGPGNKLADRGSTAETKKQESSGNQGQKYGPKKNQDSRGLAADDKWLFSTIALVLGCLPCTVKSRLSCGHAHYRYRRWYQ